MLTPIKVLKNNFVSCYSLTLNNVHGLIWILVLWEVGFYGKFYTFHLIIILGASIALFMWVSH